MALQQCPCCDFFTLSARGEYEICPVCFWEDSGINVERQDVHSGPNHMTLREGRENFRRLGACAERDLPHVLPREEWGKFERQVRTLP